jgi:hypothetical protein
MDDTSKRLSNIEIELQKFNAALPIKQEVLLQDTVLQPKRLYLYNSSKSPTFTLPNAPIGNKIELIQVAGGTNTAQILFAGGFINDQTAFNVGGADFAWTRLIKISNTQWVIDL